MKESRDMVIEKFSRKLIKAGYIASQEFLNRLSLLLHTRPIRGGILRGSPGSGKTFFVESLAKAFRLVQGTSYFYMQMFPGSGESDLLARFEPSQETISGITKITGVLPLAVEASQRRKRGFVILFLDEWDKSRPATDAFMLDFLQYKRIRWEGKTLYAGDSLVVFLGMNDERELSDPLIDRFPVVDFKPMPADVLRDILRKSSDSEFIEPAVSLYRRCQIAGVSASARSFRQLLQACELLGHQEAVRQWDWLVRTYITKSEEAHRGLLEVAHVPLSDSGTAENSSYLRFEEAKCAQPVEVEETENPEEPESEEESSSYSSPEQEEDSDDASEASGSDIGEAAVMRVADLPRFKNQVGNTFVNSPTGREGIDLSEVGKDQTVTAVVDLSKNSYDFFSHSMALSPTDFPNKIGNTEVVKTIGGEWVIVSRDRISLSLHDKLPHFCTGEVVLTGDVPVHLRDFLAIRDIRNVNFRIYEITTGEVVAVSHGLAYAKWTRIGTDNLGDPIGNIEVIVNLGRLDDASSALRILGSHACGADPRDILYIRPRMGFQEIHGMIPGVSGTVNVTSAKETRWNGDYYSYRVCVDLRNIPQDLLAAVKSAAHCVKGFVSAQEQENSCDGLSIVLDFGGYREYEKDTLNSIAESVQKIVSPLSAQRRSGEGHSHGK